MLNRALIALTGATLLAAAACSGGSAEPSQSVKQTNQPSVDCSDRSLSQAEWVQNCSTPQRDQPQNGRAGAQQGQTLTEGESVTYTAKDTVDQSDILTAKLTLRELNLYYTGHLADPDAPNPYSTKTISPDNGRFVSLSIKVENVGNKKASFLPQPYFVSDDGKKIEHINTGGVTFPDGVVEESDDPDISNQDLAPGQYAEGLWALDVPNTPGRIVIEEFDSPAVVIPIGR